MNKMLLLIFLLATPALKSSCGDLREECSGGGGTTDTFYIKHGDVYSSDGWLTSGDTLFLDTLWLSEARADTISADYLLQNLYAVSSGLSVGRSWQMNNLKTNVYTIFNSAGDYMLVPLIFQSDSIYIDSVAWVYGWVNTPPDADTVYCIYSDSTDWSTGFPIYYFIDVDTVGASEINKDTYGEKIVISIGKGYNMGSLQKGMKDIKMGVEYEKETGSGEFRWVGIILYYTRFMRR